MEPEVFIERKKVSTDLFAEPTETEIEIIKEQAAALWRSGMKVEECLLELQDLDREIDRLAAEGRKDEANRLIERFNALCDQARLYLYYLVIHREAVGFRRHPDMAKIYPIPPKRAPIR